MNNLLYIPLNIQFPQCSPCSVFYFNSSLSWEENERINDYLKYKTRLKNFLNDKKTKKICNICLNKGTNKKVISSCNHIFHKSCINTWLNVKQSCPVCKKSV